MEKNIYLVRHCKAKGQSHDAPLTNEGDIQVEELKAFFTDLELDRVISSPFTRAVQSIQPVTDQKQMSLEIDDRLSERILSENNLPDWFDKLEITFDDMYLQYEGGESSQEATDRIVEVIDELTNCEATNIIVVTHGNLMSLLLKYIDPNFGFHEWKNLSNPDVYLIHMSDLGLSYKRLWK